MSGIAEGISRNSFTSAMRICRFHIIIYGSLRILGAKGLLGLICSLISLSSQASWDQRLTSYVLSRRIHPYLLSSLELFLGLTLGVKRYSYQPASAVPSMARCILAGQKNQGLQKYFSPPLLSSDPKRYS